MKKEKYKTPEINIVILKDLYMQCVSSNGSNSEEENYCNIVRNGECIYCDHCPEGRPQATENPHVL